VQNTIHWQDDKAIASLQAARGCIQLLIAPQDGFRFETEFLGNGPGRITSLHNIFSHFFIWSFRDVVFNCRRRVPSPTRGYGIYVMVGVTTAQLTQPGNGAADVLLVLLKL
jgi:hypothetical protein